MAVTGSTRRRVPAGYGFGATANFMMQYTSVQQMLKVARVAIWNLQWQVKGFTSARPRVDQRTLLGRFVDGSDVEGIDLRSSVVNTPCSELDQQTCRLLLMNTVALYENWCHELCAAFHRSAVVTDAQVRKFEKALQFPTPSGGNPDGIESAVNGLKSVGGISQGMIRLMSRFQPTPVPMHVFSSRMKIFRVFKEARNSVAHQGGIADSLTLTAYTASQVVTPTDLVMRVVPEFPAPAIGEPIPLSWRGVIGLADMLRRVVVDADHYLMHTRVAQDDLFGRLRTDPMIFDDPAKSKAIVRYTQWARLPGGPWIIVKDHPSRGRGAVIHAIQRLTNVPDVNDQDLQAFWLDLLAGGVVEERLNLKEVN